MNRTENSFDSPHDRPADEDRWGYRHVPPLVTGLTALGPLAELAPFGTGGLHDLLLAATALMTILVWALLFVKDRVYVGVSLTLALLGTAAFLCAVFAVDGLADNIRVGLVSFGCVCIWVLQYRIDGGNAK